MSMLNRILYVDDEADIRTVVQLTLEAGGGLNVVTAGSADEAFEKLANWVPDLMLLDVMMPGTDGPTLLARLRGDPRYRNIPVVFMTAKALPREIEGFKALGALDVIPKPFDPFTLASTLRTIWARHRKAGANPGNAT